MQEQKVVRFLGVTGHYRPEGLIDIISRHPFDTILLALNAADTHIHSFTAQLLPLAVGAMANLGHKVSDQTIGNILKRQEIRQHPSENKQQVGKISSALTWR